MPESILSNTCIFSVGLGMNTRQRFTPIKLGAFVPSIDEKERKIEREKKGKGKKRKEHGWAGGRLLVKQGREPKFI